MHEHNPHELELPRGRRLARYMSWLSAVIIVLVPFHAFLAVWASSFIGQYTLLRLWKEGLLALLLVGGLYMLAAHRPFGKYVFRQPVVLVILAYAVVLAVSGLVALLQGRVTGLAYAYGFLQDSRFLVFFLVTWICALQVDLLARYWRRLLLMPAAVVSSFAVAQYLVLPPDVLRHFGYGPDTIAATSTIDNKVTYQRVQSTLRGPNPLGAYLVVVLSALAAIIVGARRIRSDVGALFAVSSLALAFSFSRSAWIGLLVSLAVVVWLAFRRHLSLRRLLAAGTVGLLVFGATLYVLRDNDTFQNAFFHTDEKSGSAVSSNEGRLGAMMSGLQDVAQEPLGRGTGTAGPASVYNTGHDIRLAENYYLQLGQEIGVIGLGLFIAINLLVARSLWRRRCGLLPALALASLAGLTAVNMLSHAWADDTLAYLWWGLAGIAVAAPVKDSDDAAV